MTSSDLKRFVQYLLDKNYIIYAPVKKQGRVLIEQIYDSRNFTLVKERPLYPFKKYLLPLKQALFNFTENNGAENHPDRSHGGKSAAYMQVLFGITVFDLRAVALLSQVFEKDSYFQDIISRTIFIGQSPVPEETTFYEKYEENILEHFKFDIFIESRSDQKDFRIFTGSKHGQRMLNNFGYGDFEHIEYAGPLQEEGLSEFHKKLVGKVKLSYGSKIWKELGKRCLGCDKCTLVCPTCFCFKIYDTSTILGAGTSASFDKTHDKSLGVNSNKGEFVRCREWDSCFNSEFSEIAGGVKFLKTIQDRIYNWYDHKFVRIPREYNLPGCVGCGRCSEVCPAGINIKEVVGQILKKKTPNIINIAGRGKKSTLKRRKAKK